MDGSSDVETDQFFETLDEMVSLSDSGSENEGNLSRNADSNSKYEIWKKEPASIQERRHMFLRQMGLIRPVNSAEANGDSSELPPPGIERLREVSGAVLRSDPYGRPIKSRSLRARMDQQRHGSCVSSSTSDASPQYSRDLEGIGDRVYSTAYGSDEFVCRIKNLDSGKEFIVDELREDGMWDKLREVGTGRHLTFEEFERTVGVSPFVREVMRRGSAVEVPEIRKEMNHSSRKLKRGWMKGLSFAAHSMSWHKNEHSNYDFEKSRGGSRSFDVSWDRPQITKVRQCRKGSKEFAALYMGQEIQAHEGSIWTMKFSLDGRYLASAGQDRVIQVRQVIESDRKFGNDSPHEDGHKAYFTVNGSPEVFPLSIEDHVNNRKVWKLKRNKKSSNSDCIVVPDKVFNLSEQPVCYFHGHDDDVLDLSWSPSQLLLSSSMDKTVRLWDMECQSCLKVFSHSDYVTCIQFNPVDERYFISGSLDGKVRIWSIPGRRVVDWSDIREMVTAVCYTPDGQGGLVGSIKGNCLSYNTSENKLQLGIQVDVYRKKGVYSKKKKSSGKKITGFQFASGDSRKVLITSADSRIRVFDGTEFVCKFKGFRNTCSQISASFTPNGKHVVCASEDSNVYIWNYDPALGSGVSHVKTCSSHERFLSESVLVAIPWSGLKNGPSHLNSPGWRNSDPSFPRCKDAGRKNRFISKAFGEDQDLETAMRYVSQGSDLSSSDTFADSNDQDGGFRTSVYLSDTYEPNFSPFPASHIHADCLNSNHGFFSESLSKGSATWPEEKLPPLNKRSFSSPTTVNYDTLNSDFADTIHVQPRVAAAAAWGLVIVTAGLGGEIRSFQNYGLPVRRL